MKYKIQLEIYGGEYVVGSLSDTTISYWVNRGQDSLDSHLLSDDQDDVPSEHHIYPWHELGSVWHTNGVELGVHNHLSIINVDTNEVIYETNLGEEWVKDNAFVINDQPVVLQDDHSLINVASVEKGYWDYEELELDTPIDPKKLQFYLYQIDGIYIVDHMKYGEIEMRVNEGLSRGKEFRVWFD